MCCVIRRALVGGAIAFVSLAAGSAAAVVPDGPRLAFVRWTERPAKIELISTDPDGLQQQTIAGGGKRARPLPFFLDSPAWSPDGSSIAFAAWPPGELEVGRTKIFVAAVDGSSLREIPGTTGGIGPVFSPDGRTIAFARARELPQKDRDGEREPDPGISTWLADVGGSGSRRLTPWRSGLEIAPSSFSPDGAVLALTRSRGRRQSDVVAMRLDGTGSSVLARKASSAAYSPDGSEIAFLRLRKRTVRRTFAPGRTLTVTETSSDLFVMGSNGSGLRRLTNTPGRFELWPSWDPSGQRLAFVQLRGGSAEILGALGFGDAIVEVNADGTCPRTVMASANLAFYGPTWQPGPGREAGPLVC